MRTFDFTLRNLLISKRVDPAELARRLGRGHSDVVAVHNWLSGRNEPSMRNLLRLSTALKISPLELIKNENGNGNFTQS